MVVSLISHVFHLLCSTFALAVIKCHFFEAALFLLYLSSITALSKNLMFFRMCTDSPNVVVCSSVIKQHPPKLLRIDMYDKMELKQLLSEQAINIILLKVLQLKCSTFLYCGIFCCQYVIKRTS